MVNKRNKKKLSSKQASRISLAISAVYFIYMFVNVMISKPTEKLALIYWIYVCALGTIIIYGVSYFFIFKGEKKEIEERIKEAEDATMQHLSYTDFKQVYFLAKGHDSNTEMLRQILQKEECKFYAKLTKNNNIYMVVKDKHNEEVFSVEITNHISFNSNFKFEE